MSIPLLRTKLYTPSLRPEIVARPRLIERLNAGLVRRSGSFAHKLTLVSAPAGFGKTTLLSEWIPQCQHPVAWLSLDERDNDPAHFWAYFSAALRSVQVDIADIGQTMRQSPQASPMDTSLTPLLNQIATVSHPFILVLDDYHTIEAPSIHEALSFLLDHVPPQMHLVIATRVDPPLPIARLRGRAQLTELYQADLRFTTEEATCFLSRVMGLDLSPEDVIALERRTEGWIAGLQMAAISMRGRDDVAGFVQAFTGSHRYILDYLSEEVLRQQPADVQSFLLQTAILDQLSAELCDAVHFDCAEMPPPLGNSQAILEHLERSNLFVIPLDDERCWYRYHRLFADLLRQRAQREMPAMVPQLHRRASAWYEENDLIAQAVRHALAANDYQRAARLIERTGWEALTRGACVTLLDWIDAFPDRFLHSHPRLGVFRAWCLTVTGETDHVESSLSDIDVQQVPGEVAAIRAYAASLQGDARRGIVYVQQALDKLPDDNLFLRSFLNLNLGIAHFSDGEPEAASQALDRAIKLSRVANRADLTLLARAILGHVQDSQARLRQALATHRAALDLARNLDDQPGPVIGMAYLGIAEVLYEWNDLDEAWRHVTEGIELLEKGRFISYLLFGHSLKAQIRLAQGDFDGAQQALQQAQQLVQEDDFVYMKAVLSGLRVRLHLARGEIATAVRWAEAHRWTGDREIDRADEAEQMAVARVLIAQGKFGEVLRTLNRLLKAAQDTGRTEAAIKILVLQTMALQAQGDVDQAISALEHLLSLAEPEGYVRTFLDEGEPMARLLRRAISEGVAPGYAARLLGVFNEEAASVSSAMDKLVEPLTDREMDVLRLIVAGLSNPEIAEELVIAVSTVKSHVNHIYGKLDVENRIQAADRARTLGLV
jgi:LuxR family maltose regulon positive regulatory protein